MKPPYQNRDLLATMFIDRGMSAREIADETDASVEAVRRWLLKHQLAVRGEMSRSKEDHSPDWSRLKE